ncbi:hypothetical protein AADZ90_006400 [Aestuariibius sp. 2305UL40-4]|uniref:hypothetical protein n=1 Tax=Aestuariibius violaceus TaxID=3234132 RepID=UPI00345E52FA
MRIWLVLSLVLNGLLIGFIAGDLSRPIDVARTLGSFSAHYPDEIRRDIRSGIWEERQIIMEELAELNSTRTELFTRMRLPETDRTSLEGLMAEVRQRTTALQERFQILTLDAVMAVPPDVRQRIEIPRGSLDLETVIADS